MKATSHKILKSAAIAAAVIAVVITALSFYMLNFALSPQRRSHDEALARFYDREPAMLRPWVDSIYAHGAVSDTAVAFPDGSRQCAIFLRGTAPTAPTALLLHGYRDRAESMLHIAWIYNHEMGFNVLIPHLRAHGESDGDCIGMGWNDRLDAMRWMDVASHMFGGDSCRMVVHGISMGAATAMCLSGEDCGPALKCVVEDCGYTSVWDEFAGELHNQFHLPEFPLMHATSALCRLRYGWSFGEASALRQLEKSTVPMLFIHGSADTFVPTAMLPRLYAAKVRGYKEQYVAPGSEHARSFTDHPQEYTARVRAFVNRVI